MEHMEICWALVSHAHIAVQMIVMGYVLYRFAGPFMLNRRGAVCTGAAYCATMLILHVIPLQVSNFTAYGIGILSALLVMYGMDRRNFRQKIFIAVTFFSLRWLSVYMTGILTEILYRKVIDTAYMAEHPYIQLAAYIAVELMYVAAEAAVAGTGARVIVKAYVYKSENMSVKELLMLIVPSVTGMIEYGIQQYYQTYFQISAHGAVSGVYYILKFLHSAVSIITIVVVTVLFQNIKARQEEKLQNELLSAQIDSTEKHIAQVESLYQDIRGIRHDMVNHILTMERLYAGGRKEEARAYGEELKNALAETTGEIRSGNPVTDVILQEWKAEAEKKNICFCSDFYYPQGSRINAFDISVVLNNALQNAMENAGGTEAPYIFVHSYHRDNAYMIEIRNSFAGELRWNAESELPVTSRGDAAENGQAHEYNQSHGYEQVHGYGLKNIRRVARKYLGDLAIDVKNTEFCLSVMLMMDGM